MKARAVIGANFGDEGKGLMTDFIVNEHKSNLVVRFNGGAQAGHTVVTPDGRRHVFGHFGSGSFAGAATLLSQFFIVNPMIFKRERQELEKKAPVNLAVTLDLDASVTTPFDMLINQLVEQKRGDARHGSCGMGIGETIERGEQYVDIKVSDLANTTALRKTLMGIRDYWVPIRKVQLNLGDEFDHIIWSEGLIKNYLADVKYMLDTTSQKDGHQVLESSFNPIFEGAQGLLLDQNHEFFPYVTRSNTGIKNVLSLVGPLYNEIEVIYMTRSYLTRHGAGPLDHELSLPPFKKIRDATNIPNEWQGSLRFAHLDIDLLKKTILNDLKCNSHLNTKLRPHLAITCLDQCNEIVPVFENGQTCDIMNFTNYNPRFEKTDDAGDSIANKVGISGSHYKSFGPTRNDVVNFMTQGDRFEDLQSRKTRLVAKATMGPMKIKHDILTKHFYHEVYSRSKRSTSRLGR